MSMVLFYGMGGFFNLSGGGVSVSGEYGIIVPLSALLSALLADGQPVSFLWGCVGVVEIWDTFRKDCFVLLNGSAQTRRLSNPWGLLFDWFTDAGRKLAVRCLAVIIYLRLTTHLIPYPC